LLERSSLSGSFVAAFAVPATQKIIMAMMANMPSSFEALIITKTFPLAMALPLL
jgi:hypothetical protein